MRRSIKTLLGASLALGSITSSFAQETQIKFFGQPEFETQSVSKKGDWVANPMSNALPPIWSDATVKTPSKSAFSQGNYVLFITSQLNDKISILNENTVKMIGNQPLFEVQRLMAKIYFKDYLSFSAGKMFNPIGIWNNQYNMGLVLQPTIQRPSIIRASNEGGVLQINNVGVQAEGNNITSLGLFYKLFVCNGNGSTSLSSNSKNQFAVTAALGVKPIDGLTVVVSTHQDQFNANQPNLSGTTNADGGKSQLYNVSAAYMNPESKIEGIVEYYTQQSKFDNLGTTSSYGLLAYAGYKVTNKFIPYIQASNLQAGTTKSTDYYYVGQTVSGGLPSDGIIYTINELTLGSRYKFTSNFVLKVEYNLKSTNQEFEDNKFFLLSKQPLFGGGYAPGYVAGNKTSSTFSHGLRVQLAFAF